MEEVFEFLGKIVAYGGGTVAIAYLTFTFLGKKTVETWFAKRLKKFEYDLNALLNRVTKIHEKEFEVLPQAWEKLHDLLDSVNQFLRETHSISLKEKSASELESFLAKQDLTEKEKNTIREHKDKNFCYFHILSEKTAKDSWDFQGYIDKNAIFLSPDIESKFREAEETVRTAWAIRNTAGISDNRRHEIIEACRIIQNKIPPIMKEIEDLVKKRLRFYEA
jgi:hydrogenase maturation factor HypF (carbamoyltransferase family)